MRTEEARQLGQREGWRGLDMHWSRKTIKSSLTPPRLGRRISDYVSIYQHIPATASSGAALAGKRLVDYRRFLHRFDVGVNKEKWAAGQNASDAFCPSICATCCFVASQVGWKTILMKDAYEALYCRTPSLTVCHESVSADSVPACRLRGTIARCVKGRDADLMLLLLIMQA